MKQIKYLKLKKNKGPWLVPHSSCLIDEVFIEKFCDNSEKKELEDAKKKKEEQDKLKAEKDLLAEEQKKIDEENNKNKDEDADGAVGGIESIVDKGMSLYNICANLNL
jgi:hypothetical protein